jgi:phosphomannomutase
VRRFSAEVDAAFIASSIKAQVSILPLSERKLKCSFHFIHGTSILVPDTLSKAGYTNVHIVPEQAVPNGDFPTVSKSRRAEALAMALALADKTNADIVVGLIQIATV